MKKFFTLAAAASLITTAAMAQSHSCPSMYARNNGNGQASSCPGVNNTPIAANVVGTSFATVPTGSKTADIIFEFASTDAWKSNPPVITAVHQTVGVSSTPVNTFPGPPGVPAVQSNGRAQVLYCSYTGATGNGNMPNANVISFLFATPGTGDQIRCSYNFSSSNSTVLNPIALPIEFYGFSASSTAKGTQLSWTTSVDPTASHFEIERSMDGKTFGAIATVSAQAAGKQGIANYEATDDLQDWNGGSKAYYRIRQVDYSGAAVYSEIKAVSTAAAVASGLEVAIHGTEIVVKSATAIEADLQQFSTGGQLLNRQHLTLQPGSNRLGAIQPGAGIVRIVSNNSVAVTRY